MQSSSREAQRNRTPTNPSLLHAKSRQDYGGRVILSLSIFFSDADRDDLDELVINYPHIAFNDAIFNSLFETNLLEKHVAGRAKQNSQ